MLARELQAQYNRDNRVVLAQPVPPQLPYKCGACGKEHMVCGAMNGALFQCINCGVQNRILLQPNTTIVVYVTPIGSNSTERVLTECV